MRKRGIGVASSFQGCNAHFGKPDYSTAAVEALADGNLVIHVAASDLGQGLEATLLEIVSQAFGGLPAARIRWTGSNTAEPNGGSTGASRQTTSTGNAVRAACEQLIQRLQDVAGELLGVPFQDVEFAGEQVLLKGAPALSLAQLLARAQIIGCDLTGQGQFAARPTTAVDENGQGEPISEFSYATHVAEVEVDTDTGEVQVLRISTYSDAGQIVHRIGAEGQVQGGSVMGLGFALIEDYMLREGQPVNVGYTNYLVPTIHDAPAVDAYFVDRPVPFGALGVKGLAELPTSTVAPAIVNAIADATGARVTHLPATPERVLAALAAAGGEASSMREVGARAEG